MPPSRTQKKLCASKVVSVAEVERLVSAANEISCKELLKDCLTSNSPISIDCCCCTFTVKCVHSSDLTSNEQLEVFSILERNMKVLLLKFKRSY